MLRTSKAVPDWGASLYRGNLPLFVRPLRNRDALSSGIVELAAPSPQVQARSTPPKQTQKQQTKQQPQPEQPLTLQSLLIEALKQKHQPQLASQLGQVEALAEQRKIKLFYLEENDLLAIAAINTLGVPADLAQGSIALLGRKIKQPIVILVHREITAIASQLKLKPWVVAQAMALHELGHALSWQVYETGVDDAGFLSEEHAWNWARNLRPKFAMLSKDSLDRVAAHCLRTHTPNS
jgi:hypothetical protein